ncbi:PTS fructose transporter subunit IIBC [Sansalvadorimonas verongulae]|uniref:PTS fructose transporter subunit IIBC n=1 Tax=Sansalvadorimonas verongulae TaxID=2172824 RepID=UPI0012BD3048|nr:PTS fructose transporter subunit IIBC [Sansalvadorimonas verongulae]MTI12990.1 PTS fructose transporter subunit IIBC [Sansalvadorimonas verongulae]
MKTVIVTACPSGIANAVLAQGVLARAAETLAWSVSFEVQSSVASIETISADDTAAAELVILVGPVSDKSRFEGKRIYHAEVGQCYEDPVMFLKTAQLEASVVTEFQDDAANTQASRSRRIVGVTACPTGVAHTFMAAEALEEEAKRRGEWIKIETRGSIGAKNHLNAEDIASADLVVIAADIDVDLSRFDGKKLYKTSTGAALKKTAQELDRAYTESEVYHHTGKAVSTKTTTEERPGVYKHLMTGVSHILPLVVAGGLAVALSFIFGIEAFKEEGTLAAALMNIGSGSAFALMVPVLAGFIAFSIADRSGLAPGLIGGMLASSTGAGFLGGIVAGFLAGYSAKAISEKVPVPGSMAALKPVLIIPLVASLFTGLIMIYVVGGPVSALMTTLTDFLNNMGAANAVLLGALLGAMMCFDMGGPVNKVAYTFGVGLLGSETYGPMAAVMAAGMIPPLGMGLATLIARRYFSAPEQEAGKAAMVLGLCFISEGAIPFAARDPMRVIPACVTGGALTGAMSMLAGVELMAPHGGLFVLLIPGAISPVLSYLLAIIAGTVVTGVVYSGLKIMEGRKQASVAVA